MIYIIFLGAIGILYIAGWIYFSLYGSKLLKKERDIGEIFASRTDSITGLYEVSKPYLERHTEVFNEILTLRKKEFNLMELSDNLEVLYEIESKIHHELNFIFQVCNTHPKLLKDKKFLYIRDIVLDKSSELGKNISLYNDYVKVYNTSIKNKNYTIIGILLPFQNKKLL